MAGWLGLVMESVVAAIRCYLYRCIRAMAVRKTMCADVYAWAGHACGCEWSGKVVGLDMDWQCAVDGEGEVGGWPAAEGAQGDDDGVEKF